MKEFLPTTMNLLIYFVMLTGGVFGWYACKRCKKNETNGWVLLLMVIPATIIVYIIFEVIENIIK